jgi:hypothetical protein
MYVVYEYTETQRKETNFYLFVYLFTVYLTTASIAQNITPSSKLIPDTDLEEVQKDAVLTPVVVLSLNFPAMSDENDETPNSNS